MLALKSERSANRHMFSSISGGRPVLPIGQTMDKRFKSMEKKLQIGNQPTDTTETGKELPHNSGKHLTHVLPILDLDKPLEELAAQVDYTAKNIGFFYVVNHGVSEYVQEDMQLASKAFFGQPRSVKEAVQMGGPKARLRGYFAERSEWLNFEGSPESYRGDLKEGYDLGFSTASSAAFFGENQWPDLEFRNCRGEMMSFRAATESYLTAVNAYCKKLMSVFALGLGYDANWFDDKVNDPLATLRLLHYRPQSTKKRPEIGCAPHSDYGMCTALLLGEVGGLEVLMPDGGWIPVEPLKGSYVTNLGDMLQTLSGKRWKSTIHRVVNTSGKDRYSIPYFFNPNASFEVVRLRGREKPDPTDVGEPPATCETMLNARYYRSKIANATRSEEIT